MKKIWTWAALTLTVVAVLATAAFLATAQQRASAAALVLGDPIKSEYQSYLKVAKVIWDGAEHEPKNRAFYKEQSQVCDKHTGAARELGSILVRDLAPYRPMGFLRKQVNRFVISTFDICIPLMAHTTDMGYYR